MFYEMTIAGCKRQLPLCKINDELYIGAFIMFSDVEITRASAAALLEKAPEFDVIITAESKGIPLAYEMARQAGINDYIVARKGPKLYMQNVITTEVDSITTDHIQTLCLGQTEIDKMKGNPAETGRLRNRRQNGSPCRRRGCRPRRYYFPGKTSSFQRRWNSKIAYKKLPRGNPQAAFFTILESQRQASQTSVNLSKFSGVHQYNRVS